jgi:hypothetical protein
MIVFSEGNTTVVKELHPLNKPLAVALVNALSIVRLVRLLQFLNA